MSCKTSAGLVATVATVTARDMGTVSLLIVVAMAIPDTQRSHLNAPRGLGN